MTHLKNMFSHVRSVFAHSCCLSCTCMALNRKCVQAGWIIHNLAFRFYDSAPTVHVLTLRLYSETSNCVKNVQQRAWKREKSDLLPSHLFSLSLYLYLPWDGRIELTCANWSINGDSQLWCTELQYGGGSSCWSLLKTWPPHLKSFISSSNWWWELDRSGSPNPDLTSSVLFCGSSWRKCSPRFTVFSLIFEPTLVCHILQWVI